MAVKLAILASGRGSNFAAIARAVKEKQIPGAEIVSLICNKPGAPVLEIARSERIATQVIDAKAFTKNGKRDRAAYDQRLLETLETLAPDFICLAGYMLLLGPAVIHRWENRILNIHPSLLPAFKGLAAQEQALSYGVKWTGCTLHFVNEEMDAGPIIAQAALEIGEKEAVESLTARLLEVEHRTYVEGLRRLCQQSYRIEGRRVSWSADTVNKIKNSNQ